MGTTTKKGGARLPAKPAQDKPRVLNLKVDTFCEEDLVYVVNAGIPGGPRSPTEAVRVLARMAKVALANPGPERAEFVEEAGRFAVKLRGEAGR